MDIGYYIFYGITNNFNLFKNTLSSTILNTHSYVLRHFPLNSLKAIVLYYVPSLQIPMSLSLDSSPSRTCSTASIRFIK